MNTIYRKSRVLKTYMLILIELFAAGASFSAAMLLRFGDFYADGNGDTHLLFGILLLTMSLMYSMLTDWNRDFFIRGFSVSLSPSGNIPPPLRW